LLDAVSGKHFSPERFPGDAAFGVRPRIGSATFEFGDLFRREFVVNVVNEFANFLEGCVPFRKREFAELFDNFGCTHGSNLLR
jgi:hypothetical protein